METNEYTNHPHLGLIPSDWVVTNSSAVCTKITDGTHDTPTPTSSGLPYIKSVHIKKGTITFESSLFLSKEDHDIIYKRCNPEKGDLLVVNIGLGNIGECAYVDVDFEFSMKNIALLKPNPKRLDGKYLYYYYESRKNRVVHATKTGGAQPFLSIKDLKKLKLVVPPLPEQRKIAEILSTWDKAITTTEKLIETSKQQKKALMQQLLTGKKRLRSSPKDGAETGNAFEGEWEEVKLDDLAIYRRGSFPQPYGNPEWVDKINGYPFIQVFDIDKNMKLKSSTKTKISDAAIGKSVFIEAGTVIVSLQGSIGRVAITQYDAYVDRTVLLFQQFKRQMDTVYFAYAIQELFEIEKEKAPGGTIKTITKQVLSNFTINVPIYTEQQKIATVITTTDKEIEVLQAKLAHFKQEKKALMQQLLTGKRRVKIDEVEAA
ncbi:restriction endonuclease subunit S [Vibrio cyclitrophicus]